VGVIERVPARNLSRLAKNAQPQQIVPVGGNRMSAHAPFVRQMRSETLNPALLLRIHPLPAPDAYRVSA
jgi:hypothetical protein